MPSPLSLTPRFSEVYAHGSPPNRFNGFARALTYTTLLVRARLPILNFQFPIANLQSAEIRSPNPRRPKETRIQNPKKTN
jgi:hypothetical protein